MLPFVTYNYQLAETLLSYADSEKDLGVHVNKSFNFNEHRKNMLTKANQKFGVLKRTCHFVNHSNRRRSEASSSIARQYGGHVVTP